VTKSDVTKSDVTKSDVTKSDVTKSDVTKSEAACASRGEGQVGGRVLTFGWKVRVSVLLGLAVLPAVFAGAALTARTSERAGFGVAFAFATLLLAASAVFVLRPVAYVDERGIERRTPLRKRTFVPWSQVTAVVANGPAFTVVGGPGGPLTLGFTLDGLDVFSYFVLTRVPEGRVTNDVLRRALAHRARRLRPLPAYALAPEPIDAAADPRERWRENPFFVLGLSPECSRADVERSGQKLLGLLAIGHASAAKYATPIGDADRTADRVRAAMAELRDPERRLAHEIWARVPEPAGPAAPVTGGAPDAPDAARPWDEAMAALGWRRP